MRPLICTRPPPISWRITGAVTTSPLPFSISRIAIRLPTFSRVTCWKMRAPGAVEGQVHGRLAGLAVEAGLRVGEAVAGQHHLLLHEQRRAAALGIELGPERHVACQRRVHGRALSSTIRTSSVAVRPRMSFALAVSCTPGSCTTMRSAPCCWIDGLGHAELVDAVVQGGDVLLDGELLGPAQRFGLERRCGSSTPRLPRVAASSKSGWVSSISRSPFPNASWSRKRTTMALPSRAMPAWRIRGPASGCADPSPRCRGAW